MLLRTFLISPLCVLSLALGCGGAQTTATAEPTAPEPDSAAPRSVVNPEFIEQYAATRGFRLGRPSNITVVPGGTELLYLRSEARSFERKLYSFNVETGQETELLNAATLFDGDTEELSPEERARRERMRLSASGIAGYELSEDGTKLLIPLSGQLFVVTRADMATQEVGTEEGYANDPHMSPDGTQIACVRNGNLYVIDIERNRERQLTSDASEQIVNGLPEFVAEEEMGRYHGYWWSPDSERLVYQQTDNTNVERLSITDPMHPEATPSSAPYPRAGTPNAGVRLGLISKNGGRTTWLNWDQGAFPYVASVRWAELEEAPGPLTVLVQNRRQTEQRLLLVEPRTGATETIHTETDAAWLNLETSVPVWLNADQFVWASEATGEWQLELRSRAGELVRALTPAGMGMTGIAGIHKDEGYAYVHASNDPLDSQVFRVPLAGGAPVQVSEGPGVHRLDEQHGIRILTNHGDAAGAAVVFRGDARVAELPSAAETPTFEANLEFITVGARDLRALVIRPQNFHAGTRYPVLVSVYGGPLHQQVRRTPRRYLIQQWYADQGYIVVSIDGRGTPGRGREWERAIHHNVIDAPLLDQVEGLQALAEQIPEMDLSRVGIWGWSFGGYFSAMAVMQRPDVFHVGAAGAPVADWRDYDTHYTERYLGLPADNDEGYTASSVLTHAPNLRRPLLIIHGTADDNVYFTHAIKMSNTLFRAGRSHEFLPLSGFTHMVSDPEVSRHLQERILSLFQTHLR